jgi:hypothetical protein
VIDNNHLARRFGNRCPYAFAYLFSTSIHRCIDTNFSASLCILVLRNKMLKTFVQVSSPFLVPTFTNCQAATSLVAGVFSPSAGRRQPAMEG